MGDSSIDEQLLKISLQLFANCPSISSCFHKRLAKNGKTTAFRGVPLFDALVRRCP